MSDLWPDGNRSPDLPIEIMIRHVDYLIEHLGVDGVALGSDFDGAVIPTAIADAAGLPNLLVALRQRGFDNATIDKICHKNWLNVLDRTWKRPAV